MDFFKQEDRWPEMPRQKKNISFIEELLETHLHELIESTKISDMSYVVVAGEEYLLQVSNTKTKNVPQDWVKISNTKAVSRYRDKYIIQKLKEREQHRELLVIAAEEAYAGFLR